MDELVYFKYTVRSSGFDGTSPYALGYNGSTNKNLIIGGRICHINNIKKTVKLTYMVIYNPDRRTISAGGSHNGSSIVQYDENVNGLPKWYAKTSPEKSRECYMNGFSDDFACKPSQWDESEDVWIRKYVTGFDRTSDKLMCGVGPSELNLPPEIPMVSLSRNVQNLLNSNNTNIITEGMVQFDPNASPNYPNGDPSNTSKSYFIKNASENLIVTQFRNARMNITFSNNRINMSLPDSTNSIDITPTGIKIEHVGRVKNRLLAMGLDQTSKTPTWYIVKSITTIRRENDGSIKSPVGGGILIDLGTENLGLIWQTLEQYVAKLNNENSDEENVMFITTDALVCELNAFLPGSCNDVISKSSTISCKNSYA